MNNVKMRIRHGEIDRVALYYDLKIHFTDYITIIQ